MRRGRRAGLLMLAALAAPMTARAQSADEHRPEQALTTLQNILQRIDQSYIRPVDWCPMVDVTKETLRQHYGLADGEISQCVPPPADAQAGKRLAPALEPMADAFKLAGIYRNPEKAEEMVDTVISAILDKLDSRSAWIGSARFASYNTSPNKRGSIGISILKEGDAVQVASVNKQGPARAAGVNAGDRILSINGVATAPMTLDEAIDALRGEIDSSITLTIAHSDGSTGEITTTRHAAQDSEFSTYRIADALVLSVDALSSNVATDMLKQGKNQLKGAKGLILDLRSNGGGNLSEAVAVADLFLDAGLIVRMRGRYSHENSSFIANKGQLAPQLPMAVLVDGETAAGAEIIAAALQDHRRATIIGRKTPGIGTIQTWQQTGATSALKITTSEDFRPNGAPISAAVTPDVESDLTGQALMDFAIDLLSRAAPASQKSASR